MGRKKTLNPKAMFSKSLLIPPTQREPSPFTKNPAMKKQVILRQRNHMDSLVKNISQINEVMRDDKKDSETSIENNLD